MFVRQDNFYFLIVLLLVIGHLAFIPSVLGECTSNKDCKNGLCAAGSCECQKGFWGNNCEYCRLRLTESQGVITDGPGKYAESATCSWLVEPQRSNTTLQFRLEEFMTECTWDHLYIYDGRSIDAPLIAVISGLVRNESIGATAAEPIRTIEAKSGSAFLYFYSDAHYNMNGFNITYRTIKDCTTKCNGHGGCNSSDHCVCESSWAGPTCDQPTCPTICKHGVCNPQTRQCHCNVGYTGMACSVHDGTAFWSIITAKNQDEIFKRASHGAVMIGDWMWVVGGYSLNGFQRKKNFVARYNVLSNAWEVINMALSSRNPVNRYGHSTVVYNNLIIVYGGDLGNKLVDELWSFDTKSLQWSKVRVSVDSHSPLAVAGHTAVVVNSTMVVMFGYSQEEYFTNSVQEFNLDTKKWSRYSSPHCIRGSFGHTSAYHPGTGLIYVHGGFRQGLYHSVELSSDLVAYDPHKRSWHTLKSSGYPRFLHSSVVIGNKMFVFGGNTHNDTGKAQPKARCYSADFLSYDIDRNVWIKVATSEIPPNAARYGHSAVTFNSTMYVFGGFNGVMFNDLLTYTAGNCSKLENRSSCLSAHNSTGCVWQQGAGNCIFPQSEYTTVEKVLLKCGNKTPCLLENGCKVSRCNYSECHSCLMDYDCLWCESQQRCHAIPAYIITFPYGQCHAWTDRKLGCLSTKCSHMKSCNDCHSLPGCGWCDDGSGTGLGQCMEGGDDGAKSRTINTSLVKCPKERWNFVGCPPCRCNGHSLCTNLSVCEDCQHNTRGPHCGYCINGYYGDARNGGRCERCHCNGHAVTCHHRTGQCDCLEEGVIGDRCENCKSLYEVNPRSYLLVEGNATEGGHCYIVLNPCDDCAPIKFNVTKKSLICIQNTPYKGRDWEIAIAVLSPGYAYLNLSVVSSVMSEKWLESDLRIGSYKHVVSHKSYKFEGSERVTFRTCIYNIHPPLAFSVLFYQPKQFLNLLIFFATFFGCFFSLLLIAAIVWKIKIRWMRHVSARRRLEEQAQRASRPFAKLFLELPKTGDCPLKSTADAVAIALEPCASSKAAVVTVLMRLPTMENGCTPIGGCGITCGSALVTCSNPSRTGQAVATRRKTKPHSKRVQTCL